MNVLFEIGLTKTTEKQPQPKKRLDFYDSPPPALLFLTAVSVI
jgi:hypothetical protein